MSSLFFLFLFNRERFIAMCLEFQKDIDKANDNELCILLSEKEFLENEIHILEEKNNALKNSMLAFVEGILEDLISSNSGTNFFLIFAHLI